ncbi:MarR family winged helix-turn-helix transcriptional regulator [Marinobacter apostichopi]|uniref:MarR family winged helix-turn-helix transcriptional regulator n=1 Tax=Marinobacter apostichopi TaxID=3035454 RepID=UPI0025745F71|nr:MarR family winged helix-turn-helix transcriptional regulator [Marinobacter sp. LA51]
MANSSLSDALHRLMHAYKRQLRAGIQQQQIPLPITHIRVLKGICRLPDATARSIAQRMNQDKAQITRVLNELMQSGLIEKTENPNDRRSQFLTPTREGAKMMSKIDALEEQAAEHMTRNLSDSELDTFVRIAGTMIESSTSDSTADKGATDNG